MSPDRPLVILAGPINAAGHANLEREARVVLCEDETEAGFIKVAAQAQGILFRTKPRCTESLMAACKNLKVVGRHGVGLDTIDIPAATKLGIAVVHAPGSNSQAVAEHALMLMLVSVKRTVQIDRMTRAGTGAAAATRRTPSWPARRWASSAWATSAAGWRSSPARSACACSATTRTCRRTS